MNHRGGWALIKATWTSWLQHRGFFFILAFGWMIPPLIYLLVWSTAADHRSFRSDTTGWPKEPTQTLPKAPAGHPLVETGKS